MHTRQCLMVNGLHFVALFSTYTVPESTLHRHLIHPFTHINTPVGDSCLARRRLSPLEANGVQCLAQGHFNMWTVSRDLNRQHFDNQFAAHSAI